MELPLLACRGLTVRFGGLLALDALDIDVGRGEVLGLIGPNGSGKTTFFNVVSGIYAASSGLVHLDGADVTSASAQSLSAHGLARTFQRSRLCLPLSGRLFEPAISLGMIDRRRVEICRALIGRPKLVLLDEPSAGMTHDETNQLMDEILGARKSLGDLTIIIVEHEMGLIERITDRCVVLNYGKKIFEGPFRQVAADPMVREAYLGQP